MKATIFDQFLVGSGWASALIHIGIGCLVGWITFGLFLMFRSLSTKNFLRSFRQASAALILLLFSIYSIVFIFLFAASNSPNIRIIDAVFVFGAMSAVHLFCRYIETNQNQKKS